MQNTNKKTIFSGIQPSGSPTLGNYLGAIMHWNKLSASYNCLYCVVDLHAITVRQDPLQLSKNSLNLYALLLACGLDPKNNILYIQSHVKEHSELAWLLGCYTYIGELSRMTQYKEKSAKHEQNINAGLFTYPILMAADILLYETHLVPVGDDQKQHLELARDIAIRFNNIYENSFIVPEPYISKQGARIMSLTNPKVKMSKSDETASFIDLLDDKDTTIKKFKKAITDSGTQIYYDPIQKPGVSNLLDIYALSLNITTEQAIKDFDGKNYGALKISTAEVVFDNILAPIQQKYFNLLDDKSYLNKTMEENAYKASELAKNKIDTIKKNIGFYR